MSAQRSADSGPRLFDAGAQLRLLRAQPLAVALTVCVCSVLFWPTTHTLLIEWLDAEKRVYTHGLLIVALSLWLTMRANAKPWNSERSVSVGAASVLALLSMLWLAMYRSGIQISHQALLPLIVICAIYGCFGREVARRSLVPLLLLYAAIPVWDLGLGVLQTLTILAVDTALQAFSIPAYVTGNLVHISSGVFEVADGCAGLHYFVVAIALAAILGELQQEPLRIRVVLLALAAVLAIVANWIRVFVIVLAGHLTNMQHYLVRVDHYNFGWLVFAVALVAFFAVARRLSKEEVSSHPLPQDVNGVSAGWSMPTSRFMATIVAAALGPLYSLFVPVAAAHAPNVTLPVQLQGWTMRSGCDLSWNPVYVDSDRQAMMQYASGTLPLCAFAATYLSQHQGKELIGYDNTVAGALAGDLIATRIVEHEGHALLEQRFERATGEHVLIWHRYVIGEYSTTRALNAQLRYGFVALSGPQAASVVAVSAQCEPTCEAAQQTMQAFLSAAKRFAPPSSLPSTE